MSSLDKNQEYLISKFLKRYDYDAILEVLEEADIIDGDLFLLIKSCNYALNFDFKNALEIIERMSTTMTSRSEIKELMCNLNNLKIGDPEDILSELIENIKIQVVKGEYIDYLGRLYRLKEALFKYIFVSSKESKTYKVCMYGYMVSKKNILYTLKKKYNIYNGN
ncbi:MAG: hypothetical protein RR942_10510, partial [Romboutsia sp.]